MHICIQVYIKATLRMCDVNKEGFVCVYAQTPAAFADQMVQQG